MKYTKRYNNKFNCGTSYFVILNTASHCSDIEYGGYIQCSLSRLRSNEHIHYMFYRKYDLTFGVTRMLSGGSYIVCQGDQEIIQNGVIDNKSHIIPLSLFFVEVV